MPNVIRLDGRPDDGRQAVSVVALRSLTGMEPDEFADALEQELGWPVPLFVYLPWERDDTKPPPNVLDAAHAVAARAPIGSQGPRLTRRRFLGGVAGLSLGANLTSGLRTSASTPSFDGAWRVSDGTAADLEALAGSYRRAYAGKAAAGELLPAATGVMHLLLDLGRRDQWPAGDHRLASLIGQTAVLVGLLELMGPRDLRSARTHYDLALRAAREAEDWDLAAYVLGSLAFHAMTDQRPADARAIRDGAWALAERRASPRTRAWAAALASELYARDGDDAGSQRLLAAAFAAIEGTREEPTWKGVGWFDAARLEAYEGGNMLLLGRYSVAEQRLRASLGQLAPTRLKHRSTLSADLAMTLVHRGEIDEACELATDALSLALAISHRESIDRVRRVHFRMLRWRSHPAVRELTERLETAA